MKDEEMKSSPLLLQNLLSLLGVNDKPVLSLNMKSKSTRHRVAVKEKPNSFKTLLAFSGLGLVMACISVYLASKEFAGFLHSSTTLEDPPVQRFSHIEYNNQSMVPAYSAEVLKEWKRKSPEGSNPLEWPGETGVPFEVPESKELQEKRFKNHYFNAFASDRIAFNRSLRDHRLPGCATKAYPQRLPSTSIVIVFYQEAFSTLIRTVHSIIRTAPQELVEEIILVDDNSTKAHLKQKLEDYVATNLTASYPIRILRQKERLGLVSARLLGASQAKGQVLTFFDSHCECNEGWLEPLLARIAEDRSRVVAPIIDVIDDQTFEYIAASDKVWGGFDWKISFRWYESPKRETDRRKGDRTEPIRTPTMSGGIFAIDAYLFNHLGRYDPGMKIWGAENLELSFRIWMCGASIEIVTCSRVGHVFRRDTPYSLPGGKEQVVQHNTARLVDVWLDEWRMFYYMLYPHAMQRESGNTDERRELRQTLNCTSFQWYLENIYPESQLPRDYHYLGQIEHVRSNNCLDAAGGMRGDGTEATVSFCRSDQHPALFLQMFMVSKADEIIYDESCLKAESGVAPKVSLEPCSGQSNQKWEFVKRLRRLFHKQSELCLDMLDSRLTLSTCDEKSRTQKWFMRNNFDWKPPTHSDNLRHED